MGLVQLLEVPAHAGASRALDNVDLRATPIERRTWGFWFFTGFWLAAVSNISKCVVCERALVDVGDRRRRELTPVPHAKSWTGGSTWLSLGITFWEGVGCSTAGYFIVRAGAYSSASAGCLFHGQRRDTDVRTDRSRCG